MQCIICLPLPFPQPSLKMVVGWVGNRLDSLDNYGYVCIQGMYERTLAKNRQRKSDAHRGWIR